VIESDEEKQAAAELREWIREQKLRAFEYGSQMARIPEDQLKHYGHKTRESALVRIFADTMRKIEARVQAHERKFPH